MSNATNNAARTAAAFAFLSKAVADEFDRDVLPDGAAHNVRASVVVEVDNDTIITREFDGNVAVGHASVRASSVGVKAPELLAYVASKMNAATREALYRELADTFTANGGKLPVTEAAIEEADAALTKLRQKVDQPVKASVRVNARRVDVDAAGKPIAAVSGIVAATVDAPAPAPAPAPKRATKSKRQG